MLTKVSEPALWPPSPSPEDLIAIKTLFELYRLNQVSTVKEYAQQFEALIPYALVDESTAIRFFIYGLQSKIKDVLWSFGPTTLSSAINYAYLQEQWKQQESNEKDEDECRNNLHEQETDSYNNVIAEEKHVRIEEESGEILDLTVAIAIAIAETEEVNYLKVEASELLDLTVAILVAEIEEVNSLKVEEDVSNWKSSRNDGIATIVIQITEAVAEEEKHRYGEKKMIEQSSMLARCLTRNFTTIQALHKNAPPSLSVRTSHTTSLISSSTATRTGQCSNQINSKILEATCDANNADPIGTFFGNGNSGFHVYHSLEGGTGSDTRKLVIPKERGEYSNSMMLASSAFSYSFLSPILLVKGQGCVGGPNYIPLHSLEWGAQIINQRGFDHKAESDTMIGGGSHERLNENDVDFTLGSGRANGEDGSGETF